MIIQDIKRARESLGISPDMFSKLIGCSHQTIYNWENGKSNPSPYYKREIKKTVKKLKKGQDQ